MDKMSCKEMIYSDDYGDYIIETLSYPELTQEIFDAECIQIVNDRTLVIHRRIPGLPELNWNIYGYTSMPKCYGTMDTANLEESGVLALRRQPYLNLYGQGILIGIADTGIDYTHPAFISADGSSRIYSIWDQTVREGPAPAGFQYGTEYVKDRINEALQREQPLELVPVTDTDGHGTFLAGIAAGNEMPEEDFSGIAPLAELVIVKLKEAKDSLKRYYGISENKTAYQENDLMLGIRYLQTVAAKLRRPLVILTGMGTNAGNHSGGLSLSRFLNRSAVFPGTAVVCSGGNEGNREHHYQKSLLEAKEQNMVEISVAEKEQGLTMELWAKAPQLFTVGIQSPLGNSTGLLPVWYGKGNPPITFPLENSRVFVEYTLVESYTGDEVIVIRILDPTPGIWRITVANTAEYSGGYHIWLPIENFLQPETGFLSPEPDITICEPGNTQNVLTATVYNHVDGAIYINASRGFTSTGVVKPEIAAPGVNVYGPTPGGRFGRKSGASIGAAHCAGVAALMLEWGIVEENNISMQTTEIKNTLIRGARREASQNYPNRVWGYGKLDAYKAFGQLRPM